MTTVNPLEKHELEVRAEELDKFETMRLIVERMQVSDFAVMNAILNSEGFLKYIGDRNIRSDDDAKAYISKTLENDNIHYWIVRLKDNNVPIGMVSFVQRDYLPCRDIGYSFLPNFTGKGYAFEAVKALLEKIPACYNVETVLAALNKDNASSVRLVEKLGFKHQKEIEINGNCSQLYEICLTGGK